MPLHKPESIRVNNAQESKSIILQVLAGQKGAARDIVLLNAGSAIYVAGVTDSIQAGISLAAKAIDSGTAQGKLAELIGISAG
jgi:anthranilate phosphoribosyltransferase